MAASAGSDVTGPLLAWRCGDRAALERRVPLVYAELRRLAHRRMRGERTGHTFQSTALVNEAYHARARGSLKRGGAMAHVAPAGGA